MIDETSPEPERAASDSTIDPASALPTRRSLREAAARSAAPVPVPSGTDEASADAIATPVSVAPAVAATVPAAPAAVAATASPPSTVTLPVAARRAGSQAKASARSVAKPSRWKSIRSLLIVAVAVPGIFGTVALPAYAFTSEESTVIAQTHDTGAQSLTVPDWTRPELARDSYSATSAEELQAAKAAKAAAEAAKLAASRSSQSNGYGDYVYNANDPELAAFLVGKSDTWIRPVAAGISSPYGPRGLVCNAAGCSNSFHDGVDFGASCGTPIKAVSAGRVTFTGSAGAYGQRVIVDHGGGLESIYGHVQTGSFKVSVGQLIEAGTVVAGIGATGVVSGCHLDLKIRIAGDFTNPVPYMASRGVTL